ncbi:MAG: hypothetical protein AB7G24_14645 [Novosphingobium sp.]
MLQADLALEAVYNEVMTEIAKTVLEWTYEPKNFFEEKTTLAHADGLIEIGEGKARGEFDAVRFDEGEAFWKPMHGFLESAFLAQQIQVHLSYTLAQPALARVHPDGRRDVSLFVESAVMVMSVGTVDIIVRDANGNITSDSKAERLGKQAQFRADVGRILPHDIALKRMLQSFRNALEDRDNLLIHLYEIRETLSAEFSGEKAAREAVSVSSGDWSKFGRLANEEPLLEGRHRGKHAALRKARPDESAWTLEFGQRLIEGYVQARSRTHPPNPKRPFGEQLPSHPWNPIGE